MDSAELVDMMTSDASASDISDYIKGLLYTKSTEKVDALRPQVAASLFGSEVEQEPEEVETEVEPETEEEPESQEEE